MNTRSLRGHRVAGGPPIAAFPRTGCLRTAYSHAAAAAQGSGESAAPSVRLSFSIPYRTEWGQDVALVGDKRELGEWDPRRGVSMRWQEGDVWSADVEVSASEHSAIEYKYVVRNPDGNAATWKPGSNYRLSLSSLLPVLASTAQRALGAVGVRDSWDDAVRDVSIQVAEPQRAPRPASEAVIERSASLAAALGELATHMVAAEDLLSRADDPLSPQMLQADRTVAAAARRVSAAAKALEAAQAAQGQLPEAHRAAADAAADAAVDAAAAIAAALSSR